MNTFLIIDIEISEALVMVLFVIITLLLNFD